MARNTPVKKAWRSLTWLLVIIAGLTALLGYGVAFQGASWAPKLALDLDGGTQITLAPKLESGQDVTPEQLAQAVSIIRERIDAAGVSEAEVTTQGDKNVIVSIPGEEPDEQTLARAQQIAELCDLHGVTLPAAAIAFPLLRPQIASVVVGMRSAAQVASTLERYRALVPPALWEQLHDLEPLHA